MSLDSGHDRKTLMSATTLDIDAVGALSLNSSGGVINIGNDAVAQNINVGSGAAARSITLGNQTGATSLLIKNGTGGEIHYPIIETVADSATDPTAAMYVKGYIDCTGGSSDTWTLPTGAALADAMPGAAVTVGQNFVCFVNNNSGGTITIEAGASGSTLHMVPLSALTIATGLMFKLEFIFDVATDGSEAYHVFAYTTTVAT